MIAWKHWAVLAAIGFSSSALVACGGDGGAGGREPAGEHGEADELERGPHGGRMLREDDFAVEITIFEAGVEPQFRVFSYLRDRPLDPADVELGIEAGRLGGDVDRFTFDAADDYRKSREIVREPHSFDVAVKATHAGRTHDWAYQSYEGRTTIADAAAKEAGVVIDEAGPALIAETIDALGRVEFAPGAEAALPARFPGQVLDVFKTVGDAVAKNEVIARIESNESLRTYEIRSPIDGVLIERRTNPGDVSAEGPLFVVGDVTRLVVDFHIFATDLGRVRAGQRVTITPVEGAAKAETAISTILPTKETATQTIIARATLANPGGEWMPGMTVRGDIVVDEEKTPLAVRTEALQRLRDFTVVFEKIGETYEVRMLETGRQTPEWTEVLSGIEPGAAYVAKNSFLIKADIEKSGASHDH